jgi:hypothetical protein
MARSHTMTPARRAALKKAQMASARKRRGKGKGKLAAANRAADSKKNKMSTKKKVALGIAYAAAYGAYAYSINKDIQAIRKSNRENKRRRQAADADAYLRGMRYGQSTTVRSTRGPSSSLHRALPTRVKALTR